MTSDEAHGGAEIVDLAGIRIPIDPEVISPSIIEAIRTGRYERPEAKVLAGMVENGERIVDIGGGLGFVSALVARTGRAELVVCVEGHPYLAPLIGRVRDLNGLDMTIRSAVISPDASCAVVPFYLHKDFWASSLLPIAEPLLRGIVEAPVLTFAQLVREYAPSMFVIDVEVVKEFLAPAEDGGDRMDAIVLDGVRKVVCQVHRSVAGAAGIKRVFDWFSSRNFVYSPVHSRGTVVLFERGQA